MSTKKLQIIGSLAGNGGDADTLDGKHANEFATVEEIDGVVYAEEESVEIENVPLNADTLGGRPAEEYALASELATKAPAGYGLGENNGIHCYDMNTAIKIGFYRLCGEQTLNPPPDLFAWGTMLVEKRETYIYQTVRTADGYKNQLMITRYSTDMGSTWTEWEWVNPPMNFGVEYRITERWNYKPVYTKLIDCGTVPVGDKTIYGGVHGVGTSGQNGLIRHYAFTNTGRNASTLGATVYDWTFNVGFSDGNIHITGGAGIGSNSETLYVQVWYTKED